MSTGLRFTLEVDGLPPDAFAVVSFHLNQSLSSLFSLDLSLVSQQFLSLEFAQVLDKMAYLTIWQGDEVQRRVKGVVTWFELGENDKNQMLYSMKVHPPLWRAGLRQNFRIFQNEDIKSILGTMLQENGVTEWSPLFSEPHPSREFCVQYGETDYDFLCRMAAEEGIFFYEEHAYKSTDQSLVLCDTVRHLPESFEIPWNPNTRTEVSTLCISQFRYSAQIRPSSVVTKDYTFKRPGWPGRFDQEGQYQDYQRTQYEVYDYPGRFKGAHGQNFARWQMDGWRNNAEVARGTSRSPEIWPGRRIVLTGHPQANLNRDRTTTVKHDHRETVKNDQTVTIQEGNRLLTVEKGHKITGVLKGSLSEDVFQDRGTIAGSVHVDAVNNGGEGDGIQAYTAIKEILLAVEESKIALTPDGIQLQVGESTVIRLSKDGITIVGGSVFIN
ncbi:type VI secretion system tip protein VgrG [Escherichia coli]|nr:type VI secretion system tip protein VgrG [Escherichia coli]